MKKLLILPVILLTMTAIAQPDVIFTKDGQELRGVVVEDYHDRVVISTTGGENSVLKQDIEKVAYDSLEDNYLKLGDSYSAKQDYSRALYYYAAALKLNPDMKQAQEAVLLTTNLISREKEMGLEKQIKLKQDAEENMGSQGTAPPPKDPLTARRKELLDKAGISLKTEGPDIVIETVVRGSSADEVGLKAGDRVVAVWGKLVKYMQLKDAYDLLLALNVGEVRLQVSRKATLHLKPNGVLSSAEKMIGGRLEIEFEGLTVASLTAGGPMEKAGVLQGDRVISIGGAPTRYLPLETACQLIEKDKSDTLDIEIQREIIFWKRG